MSNSKSPNFVVIIILGFTVTKFLTSVYSYTPPMELSNVKTQSSPFTEALSLCT